MVPAGAGLLFSQLHIHHQFGNAITAAVAGWVAMIPQGLVLLTSVAFAVGVIRLAQHQVVVQELPAVETLARVDTICLDKTGTITHGDLVLDEVDARPGVDDTLAREALAALVAADPNPNATLRAVGEGLARIPDGASAGTPVVATPSAVGGATGDTSSAPPSTDGSSVSLDSSVEPDTSLPPMPEGWTVDEAVPFSSARKWSAAAFRGKGTWVFGAPDVLLSDSDTELRATVEQHAADGTRVVMLAHSDTPLADETLPPDVMPQALALLEDRVRADAPQTLQYFADQGVTVKVISGDHPSTVAAVARRAGLDVEGDAVDARPLPEQLAQELDNATVFGRVTPHQKRAMVGALQAHGHVVAMTGDGVNDVLALKDADIGVAMGSGSSASRAAAQLVLLTGEFAALPEVVGEGRRVINNVERVSNLFITKTVYALLLAVAVSATLDTFPFLPRHFTLIDALTIGIPGFFLALAPNPLPARAGFLRRVIRFTVPYGILVGAGTFLAYQVALHRNISLEESRTTATLVVTALALFVLIQLSRPMTRWRSLLVGCMVGGFVLVMVVPFGRHFFDLKMPPSSMLVIATVIVVAAVVVGVLIDDLFAIRAVNQPEMHSRGRRHDDGDAVAAVGAGSGSQHTPDGPPLP
jgi:magnesium-transporting ATPase (P-type)